MSDAENDVVCYVCEKGEPNTSRLLECVHCGRSAHFRCKKLFGNAIARARKKTYLCSVECSEMYAHVNQKNVNLDAVVAELHALNKSMNDSRKETCQLRYVVEESRLQLSALVTTSVKIEESQQFLSNQFDTLQSDFRRFKEDMEAVKTENIKIHNEVLDWKKKHQELSTKVDSLELELDKTNRQLLAKNAVVVGLPLIEGEDTKLLVCKLGRAIGCSLDGTDVLTARRLIGKAANNSAVPILVTFREEKLKEDFFEQKRKHGVLEASVISEAFSGSSNRVSVRDEITAFGRDLLRHAKEVQSALGVKYVWPGRNGKVLIRRQDGGKVEQIGSKEELKLFSRVTAKRSLNVSTDGVGSSPMTSPRTSPQIQQLAKRTC